MMDLYLLSSLFNEIPPSSENTPLTGISIDTRTIKKGECYVAIRGTRFDGHDFLNEAIKKGAAAAIVDHPLDASIPFIVVPDTTKALGVIAHAWRKQFDIPMMALTGSCGKTTTKSVLADIFSRVGPTLFTQGTLNNDIGVPLTLLQLNSTHQFAVIELGSNHPGEIAYIAALTEPSVALVTNIAPVHLEGFGSLEGIAKEKNEIYNALQKKGIAILNHDDAFFDFFKKQNENHICFTFGIKNKSDVAADHIRNLSNGYTQFTLHYGKENAEITLPLLGQHNVMNALAAASCAYALKIPLNCVKTALESAMPVNKRMNRYQMKNGATLIDDSYNANPLAFSAIIDFLSEQKGKKILVIGDMGELGPNAISYHQQVGQQAKEKKIDLLLAVGHLSVHAINAFGKPGLHFDSKSSLIAHLKRIVRPDNIILIKGSRSTEMEDVVESLKE